jgi:hypothetical protein
MTITEFLTARLAEDEAMATSTPAYQHVFGIPHYFHANSNTSVAMNPRVARAEIASKRAIVELAVRASKADQEMLAAEAAADPGPPYIGDPFLWALAQPYAEHRDFDPAWRVDR